MKVPARVLTLATVAGIFVFASGLQAGEEKAVPAKKAATGKVVATGEGKRKGGVAGVAADNSAVLGTGLLPEAYNLLKVADHDYSGHRARAMHQIEAAAKLIGEHLTGDGHGHEAQVASDDNLRQAQSLLSQAEAKMAGKPAVHIQKAVTELSVALAVK